MPFFALNGTFWLFFGLFVTVMERLAGVSPSLRLEEREDFDYFDRWSDPDLPCSQQDDLEVVDNEPVTPRVTFVRDLLYADESEFLYVDDR